MREIEGVLCDLDGTLVDSECLHLEAWNRVLADYGHTPPADWNDDCIGLPDQHARDKAARMFPALAEVGDLLEQKQARLRDLLVRRGRALAYPGVADRLAALAAAGVGLAVGTNSIMINTRTALAAAGLLDFFPVIVTLDTVERGKPSPDIYATAARKLGLAPERCAVLEDSTAGVQAGKAAGCLVLGILSTWPAAVMAGADRLFDTTAAAMAWTLEEKVNHA